MRTLKNTGRGQKAEEQHGSRKSSSGIMSQFPKKQYNRQNDDKPQASKVLRACVLSSLTRQAKLEEMFVKYGKLKKAIRVLDRQGKPRG